MSRREVVKLIEDTNEIPFGVSWVKTMIEKGLAGGPVQITLGRISKSRDQEARYHAMINDIHRQCFRGYSLDGVKAVLVNQFSLEMAEQGEPLGNPGEKVWDWKYRAGLCAPINQEIQEGGGHGVYRVSFCGGCRV